MEPSGEVGEPRRMPAFLGLGGGEHGAAAGIEAYDTVAFPGGVDEALDALRVNAEVGIGEHAAVERHVAEGVGDLLRGGIDGQDFTRAHLADEQGAVLSGLAQKDALRLAAQRDAVGDGEGIDVEGDQFGAAGVERAEPEMAAVEEVVVVVPGPGDETVDVAGSGDFLGEDVDGRDVRRAVAEDQDFAGVANGSLGDVARRASRCAFRAALAASGGKQCHSKATHAGQQSSSRELWGVHCLGPFTAGLPMACRRRRPAGRG